MPLPTRGILALMTIVALLHVSCKQSEPASPDVEPGMFGSDAAVFSYLPQEDPFGRYQLFPRVDSVVAGSLNGSTAHRPMVSVSLNAHALSNLVDGQLPEGASFKDSSVVFKRILDNGVVSVYAVAVKQSANPRSGGGWLWAEYEPDGTVLYSMQNGGAACIGCHSLEQGPQHDLIRTFERQTP